MPRLLKKCSKCQVYTLNTQQCPSCDGPVQSAHPARFSIEDRYGSYRRKMKRELLSAHINEARDVTE
ncbi:MAG: RNA-protein complex protein Nop10 [Candidatus Hermodarchaeota archaeon]|nr:RNA-protein complex protein Nop10 [Candidatus Hermodarchaeota archaeon]